jgi:hypothetical protein
MEVPYLYIIGGRVRGNTVTVVERLNIEAGAWENAPPMKEARGNLGAACTTDGRVVAIGGNGLKTNLASCEIYDPSIGRYLGLDYICQ